MGGFFGWVNGQEVVMPTGERRIVGLLPHLKGLRDKPNATSRQKVISEIMSGVERVRVDTEKNFQDVLDRVDAISRDTIDLTHIFALSQVHEGLLLRLGSTANAGRHLFRPAALIP